MLTSECFIAILVIDNSDRRIISKLSLEKFGAGFRHLRDCYLGARGKGCFCESAMSRTDLQHRTCPLAGIDPLDLSGHRTYNPLVEHPVTEVWAAAHVVVVLGVASFLELCHVVGVD